MSQIVSVLEMGLEGFVEIAMILFEYIGVAVIIAAFVRGLICYMKKGRGTKLMLAEGFSVGLEFLLGSEILKTVTAKDLKQEILILASIIVLRVGMTLLLHWEIKSEKEEERAELEK